MSGRPRRRAWFVLAAALFAWFVAELAACVAWWAATGGVFTWSRAAAARADVLAGVRGAGGAGDGGGAARDAEAKAAALTGGPLAIHPFLGYVYDADVAGPEVSRWGFVDGASPLRARRDDRFVVAIVGGSVALHLVTHAKERLVEALQRSAALAGRSVDVVCLAIGGYKQPQQLFAVQLLLALGGHVDCVINVDGYNEVALGDENLPHGVPAWFPRSWARLLDRTPSPAQQLRLGELAVLERDRGAAAASAGGWLAWSPVRQFVWLVGERRALARSAALRAEIERAAATPSFASTGPGVAGADAAAARATMAATWRRASLQLHAACAQHGAHYLHFLQPNQYVPGSKPIGPAEAARALARGGVSAAAVHDGYPLLQREGEALRAAGVAFTDLTGIFRDHPEPLYVDTCCHLSAAGNALLAEHVAAGVRRALELGDAKMVGLRIAPERLVLASPMPSPALAVVAIDDRGGEHDVRGAGFGVRYRSTPDGFLVVAADGGVRATRRGEGSLHVEFAGVATVVPVSAAWPDVATAADARGSDPPSLAAVLDGDAIAAQVAGLGAGTFRLLVAGPAPLPYATTGVDTEGLHGSLPLPADTPTAQLRVPRQGGPGVPTFLRVFVLDANAQTIAASRTVVVTPP